MITPALWAYLVLLAAAPFGHAMPTHGIMNKLEVPNAEDPNSHTIKLVNHVESLDEEADRHATSTFDVSHQLKRDTRQVSFHIPVGRPMLQPRLGFQDAQFPPAMPNIMNHHQQPHLQFHNAPYSPQMPNIINHRQLDFVPQNYHVSSEARGGSILQAGSRISAAFHNLFNSRVAPPVQHTVPIHQVASKIVNFDTQSPVEPHQYYTVRDRQGDLPPVVIITGGSHCPGDPRHCPLRPDLDDGPNSSHHREQVDHPESEKHKGSFHVRPAQEDNQALRELEPMEDFGNSKGQLDLLKPIETNIDIRHSV